MSGSVRPIGASIAKSIRRTRPSPPFTSSTSARSSTAATDDESNLCLTCIDCNLHKGPNLTGIDPQTDAITPLFHPRQQTWDEHSRWNGIHIEGQTAFGRTTIRVLCMNSDEQLELRMAGE